MSQIELLNIQNAFHQGQYQSVADYDISSISAENIVTARILKLRAQVENGQTQQALANLETEGKEPDFVVFKAFAQFRSGDITAAVREVEKLIESSSDNATVQVLGGTVLAAAGRAEEALMLLSQHQGNLEAYAIYPRLWHLIF